MASTEATPLFFIRRKFDGSADSICLRCFQTVATRSNEVDLPDCQSEHVCDAKHREKHIHLTE